MNSPSLEFGFVGESKTAQYLMKKFNWLILPAYQIERHVGKGPVLYLPSNHKLITPDMFAFLPNRETLWVEAKHKTTFSWHYITRNPEMDLRRHWDDGIDFRHWRDYCQVKKETGIDVWLMFLHENPIPHIRDRSYPGCPELCPIGLFGQEISQLESTICHYSPPWWPDEMVYWNKSVLREFSDYQVELTSEAAEILYEFRHRWD